MKKKQELIYGVWVILLFIISGTVLLITPIPGLVQGTTNVPTSISVLGVGVLCLVASAYFFWERRREKRFYDQEEQEEKDRELAQVNQR